jgi:glycosyltransferase involved in cell wall biosynthesis
MAVRRRVRLDHQGGERVSCIVPAHNAATYLDEALTSILGQTHPPFEVVVVNDGSTDETADIARRHGPPVRVINRECGSPAATRNAGIEASEGEFVAFLDPDDLWHKDKLRLQLDRFRARPSLDGSVTHVRNFWSDGLLEEEARYRDHPRMKSIPGYAFITLLARRRAFATVGLLSPGRWFSDSTEWFVRARERGQEIELLPDVLTLHRLHASNLTRRRDGASREEFVDLVRASLVRRRAGR